MDLGWSEASHVVYAEPVHAGGSQEFQGGVLPLGGRLPLGLFFHAPAKAVLYLPWEPGDAQEEMLRVLEMAWMEEESGLPSSVNWKRALPGAVPVA